MQYQIYTFHSLGLCLNISGDDAEREMFQKYKSYMRSKPTIKVLVLFNFTMNLAKWEALCFDFPAIRLRVIRFFQTYSEVAEHDVVILTQDGILLNNEVIEKC